nr:immunoglobulin heavy chain junction region [Macaca mulatta]MOY24783.1 immunoglobulin heavy chain junction region [Macaca mulatta]MOY30342.1 immunoglobulin heavy chain junction region [Macaca mulatta]
CAREEVEETNGLDSW